MFNLVVNNVCFLYKRGGSKCKRTGIYKGVYYGTFFLPQTRSMSGISDNMPVLQFKDEATYNNTVNKLKTMSEKERKVLHENFRFYICRTSTQYCR